MLGASFTRKKGVSWGPKWLPSGGTGIHNEFKKVLSRDRFWHLLSQCELSSRLHGSTISKGLEGLVFYIFCTFCQSCLGDLLLHTCLAVLVPSGEHLCSKRAIDQPEIV